jgi:hypothetical protein
MIGIHDAALIFACAIVAIPFVCVWMMTRHG